MIMTPHAAVPTERFPSVEEPPSFCPSEETGPLRFWEIEGYLKCPVVGLCLTEVEQEHLLRRFGVQTRHMSPFEIHEVLVACGESENRLSLRVQGFLERKYGRRVREFHERDEPSLFREWEAAFASGRFAEPFWAIVTRRGFPEKGYRRIFGDVHMAMHRSPERQERDKRGFQEIRKAHEELKGKFRDSENARKALEADRNSLERERTALLRRVPEGEAARDAPARDRTTEDGERTRRAEEERRKLVARAEIAEERCAARDRQLEELKARVEELEREKEQTDLFLREARRVLDGMREEGKCDPLCPACDLCRKRVLIVGGIDRMETLYRRLVEGNGGIFDHHDGKVRGGSRQLEERFRRADVVLCPVSCNSHAACLLVKNLGKKYDKPVRMLDNHSVTSMARAMEL
jgi:hypothetical protein